MAIVTFRIPDHCAGKIDSRKVRRWLVTYLKHPVLLPSDPGAGKVRISISHPDHLHENREDSEGRLSQWSASAHNCG
jgi:hypothetical protein